MRTVLRNNREAVHVWASQSQETGRAGNISFEGDSIYSYGHWIMARFIEPGVVLIRDDKYSVTTSSHQRLVRSAVSHCKTLEVANLDRPPKHQENMQHLLAKTREAADKFWGALGWCGSWHEKRYKEVVKQAKDYAEYFKLALPPLFGLELSGQRAKAKRKQQKQFEDTRAEREAEQQRRRDAAYEKAAPMLDQLRSSFEQRWMSGEQLHRGHREKVVVDGFTFYAGCSFSQDRLRYRPERDEVETSQGAYVSAKAARLLYDRIVAGKPVHGHKINNYTVIGYNGELKVGCHVIGRSEIDRFAKVMNWS